MIRNMLGGRRRRNRHHHRRRRHRRRGVAFVGSEAQAIMGACPSRALPSGGWYRDGRGRWVHVEVKVIISDGCDNGLRGEGTMVATNVLAASFAHRPNNPLRGEVGPSNICDEAQGGYACWGYYDRTGEAGASRSFSS